MIIAVLIFTATPFMSNTAEASGKATQDEIVNYAKQFVGVPYKWAGNTPSTGFDCSGYTTYVFNQKFGFNLPRTSGGQYGVGTAVSKANLQKGDLVFFSYTAGSKNVEHVGIYTGNGNFISATNSKGIAIENLNTNPYWAPRYIGAKRVPGVTAQTTQVAAPKPAPAPVLKPLPAGQYHDVKSTHWANPAINTLGKAGIITGYDVSLYKPDQAVTRAEAAIMIARSLKIQPASGTAFKDVSKDHWAAGHIKALADRGLLTGRENGNFAPKANITRAEITALLTRAYSMTATTSNVSFTDINGHWAQSEIIQVASAQVAKGYNDGTFKPNANATRAEFAQFVYNASY